MVFATPGIIPACAGNTKKVAHGVRHAWDHPRVCGEHDSLLAEGLAEWGSSPRVRGTHCLTAAACVQGGIIPACAGNTRRYSRASKTYRDHPRVCGEHSVHEMGYWSLRGSSPRVRGTQLVHPLPADHAGIIPACAGNTLRSYRLLPKARDHPRVCGEHTPDMWALIAALGSSPRVRGTRGSLILKGRWWGIIPACAGNTCRQATPVPGTRDHPRVCGEHTLRCTFGT